MEGCWGKRNSQSKGPRAQPLPCKRPRHPQQLQLHPFVKPHQTLTLSRRPLCFLGSHFGRASTGILGRVPAGRSPWRDAVCLGMGHPGAGGCCPAWSWGGGVGEPHLHHQQQSSGSNPGPSPAQKYISQAFYTLSCDLF